MIFVFIYQLKISFKKLEKLSVVVHSYNPSSWEAKAVGSQVQGQPGLHSETLHQNKQKKLKKNNQLRQKVCVHVCVCVRKRIFTRK
jgi:hypothetical protein